jgi:hypothetical protein
LKLECQHFLDCIRGEATPITGGAQGLEVVRILEASNHSLKQQGQAINLGLPAHSANGDHARHINGNGKTNGHNGNGNGHNHGVVIPAGARSVLAA